MGLFGRRQVVDETLRQEVRELRDELEKVQRAFRQVETEWISVHSDVKRWMRRAIAAERVVERNQEPARPAPPAPPPSAETVLTLRGARARIAARKAREREESASPAPVVEEPALTVGETNGVHS